MKTDIHLWSHLSRFFSEWEIFQTKVVQKIRTHILCPQIFSKIVPLRGNVEKYGITRHTSSDDKIIRRMLVACCWRLPTHSRNMHTYCFSTEIRVTRTCLNVALGTSSVLFCFLIMTKDDDVRYNVNFAPEQATKAQRGSRGITLLFL
jgi:hypothetical protein